TFQNFIENDDDDDIQFLSSPVLQCRLIILLSICFCSLVKL
ncbi:unnamed protein product, partial [marine sediment metagenome]